LSLYLQRGFKKKLLRLHDMMLIYLLTAIVLSPGGSSTAHIYTQTTQNNTINKCGRKDFWDSNPEWSN